MKFPLFPEASRHPIFCNDIIQHRDKKINKNNEFFSGKKITKERENRKWLFTFLTFYGRMYLVEIGVFLKNSRKTMGNVQMNADFPKNFFVVFYQLLQGQTAVGLKYITGSCKKTPFCGAKFADRLKSIYGGY